MEMIWSKYWLKTGMEVVHRDYAFKDNQFSIYVDNLIKARVRRWDSIKGDMVYNQMVVGVKCHYFENSINGKPKYIPCRFNIYELIPKEVIDLGEEITNKWLNRENK